MYVSILWLSWFQQTVIQSILILTSDSTCDSNLSLMIKVKMNRVKADWQEMKQMPAWTTANDPTGKTWHEWHWSVTGSPIVWEWAGKKDYASRLWSIWKMLYVWEIKTEKKKSSLHALGAKVWMNKPKLIGMVLN